VELRLRVDVPAVRSAERPDEQPLFLWKHWLPSETIEERMRKERLPLDKWVEEAR
jgi:hypothetical protein